MYRNPILREIVTVLAIVIMTSGCSMCSTVHSDGGFNGFLTENRTRSQISRAEVVLDLKTSDAGLVQVKIPAETVSESVSADIIAGPNKETDAEFQSHPYTTGLQKIAGEVRIILGKTQPTKPIQICLNRSRVFRSDGQDLIPFAHEFHDGENETMSYFFTPGRKPSGDMDCLELEPKIFSNLDNVDNRFETFIVFAKKISEK